MPRPKFRIACCLCGKPIPQASDVFALDAEWQRRYPQMVGTLACSTCALRTEWSCKQGGRYVDGHIPSAYQPAEQDFDGWSHVGPGGTHVFMVTGHPWSGLLQGAEEYLRYTAQRSGVGDSVARRIQAALAEWDARTA